MRQHHSRALRCSSSAGHTWNTSSSVSRRRTCTPPSRCSVHRSARFRSCTPTTAGIGPGTLASAAGEAGNRCSARVTPSLAPNDEVSSAVGAPGHHAGMNTFTIVPTGAYSLRESAEFGFGGRSADRFDGVMRLAFCLDGYRSQVGVELRQDKAGVYGVVHGADSTELSAVRNQVARVLSL